MASALLRWKIHNKCNVPAGPMYNCDYINRFAGELLLGHMQEQRALTEPSHGFSQVTLFLPLPTIPSNSHDDLIRTEQQEGCAMHKWVFKWTHGCECTLKQKQNTNKETIAKFFRMEIFPLIWNKQSREGTSTIPVIILSLDPGSILCWILENKTMIMTHTGPVGGSSQN